jgi:hypothetical protein
LALWYTLSMDLLPLKGQFERLRAYRFNLRPGQWIIFFSLVGFGLRLQQLDFQPLWGDEGWSFYLAGQPLPDLFALTAIDIHPPLYYVLLKGWLFIAGIGAEEARFFSILAGVVLIPVLAVVGQRLFGARLGPIAAAITALMPMAIYYSQEVRMYGLVTLLGVISVYFLARLEQLDGFDIASAQPFRAARPPAENASASEDASLLIHQRSEHPQMRTEGASLLIHQRSEHPQMRTEGASLLIHRRSEHPQMRTEGASLLIHRRSEHPQMRTQLSEEALLSLRKKAGRFTWAYIVATAAALYTHYYAVFIVLVQVAYLLLTYLWRGRAFAFRSIRDLSNLLLPFITIGLLYLPWVVYAGSRLLNYVENKRGVEGYIPLAFVHFWVDHIVAFSLGHLSANLQDYRWAALAVAVIALLGFLTTLYGKNRRAVLLLLYLFGPLLLGYLINLFYPFTPRFFERTLLLAAPAYWLYTALGLLWLRERHILLAGTAATTMLLVICVTLIGFYSTFRYPHEDYRPLLSEIAAQAVPEDTILASYQWQLGFYQAYLPAPHPKFFVVPGWGQGWSSANPNSQLMPDLTGLLAESPRLWFPAYQASGHIWEDEAEAALAKLGYPAVLKWYSPQTKLVMTGGTQVLTRPAPTANFENRLRLLEAAVGEETYQAGRDVIPASLVWQKQKNLGSDHYVSLRLADATGYTWTTRDSYPQAGHAFFTDMAIGDIMIDRHGLLTPAGAPPGRYRLLLSIRRVNDARPLDLVDEASQPLGAELLLAEVELVIPDPPVGLAALPVQVVTEANFEQQLQLVGYTVGQGPFKAGEVLPLVLFWQALADYPAVSTIVMELQDGAGNVAASFEQGPIWPTGQWREGSIWRDPHDFILPPALRPGDYRLVVGLVTPEQNWLKVNGDQQLRLGSVTTIDRPHVFEPPAPEIELDVVFGQQARLVGLDLPQTQVKAGETLPLTLYWQAVAPLERNWTVFVHLVNSEGEIVSQQDQMPGQGQFPTMGWTPSEYLVDGYNLPIPAQTLPGDEAYKLRIGLYDANDSSRLPVTEAGEAIQEYIVLENWPISIR